MFIVILVTSLVTIIILIITSASYLISLISNNTDDIGSLDLAIDTHDFNTSPTISPANLLMNPIVTCDNPKHHHHHEPLSSVLLLHPALIRPPKKLKTSNQHNDSSVQESQQSQDITSSNEINAEASQIENSCIASVADHKNMLTNQLGALASKQLYEDFDQKEMELGGTGLHWCKTRTSLDKLIKLGLPLDILNRRQETALHVAVRKRKLQVLIGLLCHGADVECVNENGQSPLIISCKVNDIFACQLLLVFDANVNAIDNFGLSARHYAAAICDKHKGQQLPSAAHLILAMLNEIGAKRCPEYISKSSNCQQPVDRGNPTSKVKSAISICKDGCSYLGSYNGNSYNRWPNYNKESLYKRHMFADIIDKRQKLNLAEIDRRKCQSESTGNFSSPIKRSRLLCIDGGGMRGVIVCQIMIEMEKYLKKPMVNYFDWIGGTSVGAFLSCALCTGTSLHQLRRICFDVKDEIFSGNKPYSSKFLERVFKRTFGSSTRMSDIKNKNLAVTTVIADRDPCQLRFFRNYLSPSHLLERYGYTADIFNNISDYSILTLTRRQIALTNDKFMNLTRMASKTNAPPITKSSSDLVSLKETTNQATVIIKTTCESKIATSPIKSNLSQSQSMAENIDLLKDTELKPATKENKNDSTVDSVIDENEQDPFIWQAVRASAAAPFFFKPYGPYLDGGIISNNPTMDMLTEFHSHQRVRSFLKSRIKQNSACSQIAQEHDLNFHEEPPSKLDLVVSLGTGRGRVIGRHAMVDYGNVASGFATVFSPVELLRSIRAVRDLFKKLMQQSCHTEDYILDRAQAWCSSLEIPYFRINPPLATIFSLDDKRDEQLINALWQTKLYMRAMGPQLEQLGELLDYAGND